ncbi:MAC/Perforin domain-containing protein [Irpex rosettiformis]|uniref:MAC/Perforin domain-containing protein n=1 Tax=Irpex rosettiformis TaxID=378272 RepID=A0ACB8U1A3_9APHY|nr:MAC/Perforin domain-containing protein [Irpex rosettiformis]
MSTIEISKDIQERMLKQLKQFAYNKDSFLSVASPDADTPDDYIPGLYTLGSTYDVLNGKYADSKSALQQVIDWDKTESRVQQYGGKTYSIPKVVNYVSNTTSDYRSYYGKTVTDYTESLSVHAGFEASYPGFSASASADYSESQRENLSNTFTRIMYVVTQYNLSLPPLSQLPSLLKSFFVEELDTLDPVKLYKQYGTHLLTSLTIGGRASFLASTDSRKYSSDMSVEAAAHISAQYLVASGDIDLSASEKQAMESFNESSETSVVTRGGDPRYGNEEFLSHSSDWAASVVEYPEFVDFGSSPCFIGIWELASTEKRRNDLEAAYKQYVKDYKANLELPGPYLRVRRTTDMVEAGAGILDFPTTAVLRFPTNRSGDWYFVSPGATITQIISILQGLPADEYPAVIVSELVPGALAPVKWEKACDSPGARFWRAVPPTSDYVALGAVGMSGDFAQIFNQPPEEVANRFRAVHKSALTSAEYGVQDVYSSPFAENCKIFSVDGQYWYADTAPLNRLDCMRLDPKNVIIEDSKQFVNA